MDEERKGEMNEFERGEKDEEGSRDGWGRGEKGEEGTEEMGKERERRMIKREKNEEGKGEIYEEEDEVIKEGREG